MLHIHRAERADGLVEALARLLAEAPSDPFAPEVVAVPTRGMERWLTQRLSAVLGAQDGRGDGVCANVEFPSPARLITGAVATASGVDPDADPWVPERAVWPLLEVVEAEIAAPWLRPLARFLGPEEHKAARRWRTVRHLAGLFDRYGLYRPDMIARWHAGEDEHWQAQLWRRLRAQIGPSPAERRGPACDRLRAEPALLELPERLAVFGLTRLPAGRVEVLRALAHGRDVHLFLLHPSPALWETLAGRAPAVLRKDDDTAELTTNRLLASWGRDTRELQLTIAAGEHEDHHHPVEHPHGTLLAGLQTAVRSDTEPAAPAAYDPADRSVEIHACHGRARQVEVLRDAILHVLQDDPTLEPRDVIVLCPDIETFAPLIQATFGAGEGFEDEVSPVPTADRPPDLRVRLA
ncbi:MAG: exodeoxyribonuclease gamma subunit, partial [Solirubrobacteraceae bacterium]|nr:exodeoxyribonuclease gamma subunit [Solirubrobacteraceae bacterium]